MSLEAKVLKGASWLALFKFTSQAFSWVVTIWIARILDPADYGLMEMAMILTAYALMFNELGLGKAIIQKPKINQNELSSVFWFAITISLILALSCFGLAYITEYIFNEPKVIPLTMASSLIFLTSGLQIVPSNLLKKNLEFKKVGLIEMSSTFISSISMVLIAKSGGGPWTFIGGYITRSFISLILLYRTVKWFPKFHFDFQEAKIYLKFGIIVAITGSLSYLNEKLDRFFAGRAWTSQVLGYYTMALQLAQIPTEKIVVLINQVSFSAFAQLQNDHEKLRDFYNKIIQVTATLVLPIFVGIFLVGEDLVVVLLTEKWYSIIFLVKYLALTQIMTALNSVNNNVHIAQGRPKWSMAFNATRVILMGISFYFAVQYGLNSIIIPWCTTYIILCLAWIAITIKKIGLCYFSYLKNLLHPIAATITMSFAIFFITKMNIISSLKLNNLLVYLIIEIVTGALFYIGYHWFFNRQTFYYIRKVMKS